jgi:hypothetical protein
LSTGGAGLPAPPAYVSVRRDEEERRTQRNGWWPA